ncbi:MAG: hypothetical protein KDA90_13465, partial [Planctomycetaceae bacterium]|nr:hypothetical protein [Planctomycetaceae bacterium]
RTNYSCGLTKVSKFRQRPEILFAEQSRIASGVSTSKQRSQLELREPAFLQRPVTFLGQTRAFLGGTVTPIGR